MTIYQLLSSLTPGDAVGNDVVSIDFLLSSLGYTSRIVAFNIDSCYTHKAAVFDKSCIKPDDIVIYHKSTGGTLSQIYANLTCKKILRYHNITPGYFFAPYRPLLAHHLDQGRKKLSLLASCTDYCIPVSQYNASELIEAGFNPAQITVLPVHIQFNDYETAPDTKLLSRLKNSKGTRLLFTGRISPNKKIEDIIKVFYYYKTFVDPAAKLYLVGSTATSGKYYAKLCGFVADLHLPDVYFIGHISFAQILSYYRAADVFVCMSEHEGFCVPLLEAMYFNVPIVSYSSSAIPETLGGCGILLQEKDFIAASEAVRLLQTDPEHRRRILCAQQNRLEYFKSKNMNSLFLTAITHIIEKI